MFHKKFIISVLTRSKITHVIRKISFFLNMWFLLAQAMEGPEAPDDVG